MSYAVIGGTFDILHAGHKKLIVKAFKICEKVLIGITSAEMVEEKTALKPINPFEVRKTNLIDFLKKEKYIKRSVLEKINDPFTPAMKTDLTHIIVSYETEENAKKINQLRKKSNLDELQIVVINWAYAKDNKPVSDERIRKGEIDTNGNLLKK